jgi:hypothetical protein
MNYLLSAVLLLLVFVCARAAYRLERAVKANDEFARQPENLPSVLSDMLETVRQEARWDQVERMRHEVRLALRDLDGLRHDRRNVPLRNSKALLRAAELNG